MPGKSKPRGQAAQKLAAQKLAAQKLAAGLFRVRSVRPARSAQGPRTSDVRTGRAHKAGGAIDLQSKTEFPELGARSVQGAVTAPAAVKPTTQLKPNAAAFVPIATAAGLRPAAASAAVPGAAPARREPPGLEGTINLDDARKRVAASAQAASAAVGAAASLKQGTPLESIAEGDSLDTKKQKAIALINRVYKDLPEPSLIELRDAINAHKDPILAALALVRSPDIISGDSKSSMKNRIDIALGGTISALQAKIASPISTFNSICEKVNAQPLDTNAQHNVKEIIKTVLASAPAAAGAAAAARPVSAAPRVGGVGVGAGAGAPARSAAAPAAGAAPTIQHTTASQKNSTMKNSSDSNTPIPTAEATDALNTLIAAMKNKDLTLEKQKEAANVFVQAVKDGHINVMSTVEGVAGRTALVEKVSDRTALHAAAIYGKAAIAQILLENGADQALEDYEGNTAFQLADKNKQNGAGVQSVFRNFELRAARVAAAPAPTPTAAAAGAAPARREPPGLEGTMNPDDARKRVAASAQAQAAARAAAGAPASLKPGAGAPAATAGAAGAGAAAAPAAPSVGAASASASAAPRVGAASASASASASAPATAASAAQGAGAEIPHQHIWSEAYDDAEAAQQPAAPATAAATTGGAPASAAAGGTGGTGGGAAAVSAPVPAAGVGRPDPDATAAPRVGGADTAGAGAGTEGATAAAATAPARLAAAASAAAGTAQAQAQALRLIDATDAHIGAASGRSSDQGRREYSTEELHTLLRQADTASGENQAIIARVPSSFGDRTQSQFPQTQQQIGEQTMSRETEPKGAGAAGAAPAPAAAAAALSPAAQPKGKAAYAAGRVRTKNEMQGLSPELQIQAAEARMAEFIYKAKLEKAGKAAGLEGVSKAAETTIKTEHAEEARKCTKAILAKATAGQKLTDVEKEAKEAHDAIEAQKELEAKAAKIAKGNEKEAHAYLLQHSARLALRETLKGAEPTREAIDRFVEIMKSTGNVGNKLDDALLGTDFQCQSKTDLADKVSKGAGQAAQAFHQTAIARAIAEQAVKELEAQETADKDNIADTKKGRGTIDETYKKMVFGSDAIAKELSGLVIDDAVDLALKSVFDNIDVKVAKELKASLKKELDGRVEFLKRFALAADSQAHKNAIVAAIKKQMLESSGADGKLNRDYNAGNSAGTIVENLGMLGRPSELPDVSVKFMSETEQKVAARHEAFKKATDLVNGFIQKMQYEHTKFDLNPELKRGLVERIVAKATATEGKLDLDKDGMKFIDAFERELRERGDDVVHLNKTLRFAHFAPEKKAGLFAGFKKLEAPKTGNKDDAEQIAQGSAALDSMISKATTGKSTAKLYLAKSDAEAVLEAAMSQYRYKTFGYDVDFNLDRLDTKVKDGILANIRKGLEDHRAGGQRFTIEQIADQLQPGMAAIAKLLPKTRRRSQTQEKISVASLKEEGTTLEQFCNDVVDSKKLRASVGLTSEEAKEQLKKDIKEKYNALEKQLVKDQRQAGKTNDDAAMIIKAKRDSLEAAKDAAIKAVDECLKEHKDIVFDKATMSSLKEAIRFASLTIKADSKVVEMDIRSAFAEATEHAIVTRGFDSIADQGREEHLFTILRGEPKREVTLALEGPADRAADAAHFFEAVERLSSSGEADKVKAIKMLDDPANADLLLNYKIAMYNEKTGEHDFAPFHEHPMGKDVKGIVDRFRTLQALQAAHGRTDIVTLAKYYDQLCADGKIDRGNIESKLSKGGMTLLQQLVDGNAKYIKVNGINTFVSAGSPEQIQKAEKLIQLYNTNLDSSGNFKPGFDIEAAARAVYPRQENPIVALSELIGAVGLGGGEDEDAKKSPFHSNIARCIAAHAEKERVRGVKQKLKTGIKDKVYVARVVSRTTSREAQKAAKAEIARTLETAKAAKDAEAAALEAATKAESAVDTLKDEGKTGTVVAALAATVGALALKDVHNIEMNALLRKCIDKVPKNRSEALESFSKPQTAALVLANYKEFEAALGALSLVISDKAQESMKNNLKQFGEYYLAVHSSEGSSFEDGLPKSDLNAGKATAVATRVVEFEGQLRSATPYAEALDAGAAVPKADVIAMLKDEKRSVELKDGKRALVDFAGATSDKKTVIEECVKGMYQKPSMDFAELAQKLKEAGVEPTKVMIEGLSLDLVSRDVYGESVAEQMRAMDERGQEEEASKWTVAARKTAAAEAAKAVKEAAVDAAKVAKALEAARVVTRKAEAAEAARAVKEAADVQKTAEALRARAQKEALAQVQASTTRARAAAAQKAAARPAFTLGGVLDVDPLEAEAKKQFAIIQHQNYKPEVGLVKEAVYELAVIAVKGKPSHLKGLVGVKPELAEAAINALKNAYGDDKRTGVNLKKVRVNRKMNEAGFKALLAEINESGQQREQTASPADSLSASRPRDDFGAESFPASSPRRGSTGSFSEASAHAAGSPSPSAEDGYSSEEEPGPRPLVARRRGSSSTSPLARPLAVRAAVSPSPLREAVSPSSQRAERAGSPPPLSRGGSAFTVASGTGDVPAQPLPPPPSYSSAYTTGEEKLSKIHAFVNPWNKNSLDRFINFSKENRAIAQMNPEERSLVQDNPNYVAQGLRVLRKMEPEEISAVLIASGVDKKKAEEAITRIKSLEGMQVQARSAGQAAQLGKAPSGRGGIFGRRKANPDKGPSV